MIYFLYVSNIIICIILLYSTSVYRVFIFYFSQNSKDWTHKFLDCSNNFIIISSFLKWVYYIIHVIQYTIMPPNSWLTFLRLFLVHASHKTGQLILRIPRKVLNQIKAGKSLCCVPTTVARHWVGLCNGCVIFDIFEW